MRFRRLWVGISDFIVHTDYAGCAICRGEGPRTVREHEHPEVRSMLRIQLNVCGLFGGKAGWSLLFTLHI